MGPEIPRKIPWDKSHQDSVGLGLLATPPEKRRAMPGVQLGVGRGEPWRSLHPWAWGGRGAGYVR